MLISAKGVKRQ